ncbi:hypothetical protein E1742_14430 [Pseudoduganella plicata]|nr:hypothetical protein E1742_14430 [Pseudoduganella plicata]
MLVVTTGGWESHHSARGINWPLDDLLFPIHHGILHDPGFDVLPPLVVYRSSRMDDMRYSDICGELGRRLDTLATTPPIPYRQQNRGDYNIPALALKEDVAPGMTGFAAHVAADV